MNGNMQVLEFFLREETRPDRRMYIPLIVAKKGHMKMLTYALDHGFHLQHGDPLVLQRFALAAAIAHQQPGTVEVLIRRIDVGPNTGLFRRGNTAITLLITAVDYGSVEIVRLLKPLGTTTKGVITRATGYTRARRNPRWR
jgi:hypothetical protein